jgi:hypothetical protein
VEVAVQIAHLGGSRLPVRTARQRDRGSRHPGGPPRGVARPFELLGLDRPPAQQFDIDRPGPGGGQAGYLGGAEMTSPGP